jgi:hypothetical protein
MLYPAAPQRRAKKERNPIGLFCLARKFFLGLSQKTFFHPRAHGNPEFSSNFVELFTYMKLMQHAKKILVLLLPAAALLSSCGGLRHTRVEEVRGVSLRSVGGGKMLVNMDVKISSQSSLTVRLSKLALNVELDGAPFAAISTVDMLKVPPRNDAFLPVTLELRLQNMLPALMVMLQQKQNLSDKLTIEGTLKVSTFLWRRTLKIEKQNLTAFAAQYGDFITPLLKQQSK